MRSCTCMFCLDLTFEYGGLDDMLSDLLTTVFYGENLKPTL